MGLMVFIFKIFTSDLNYKRKKQSLIANEDPFALIFELFFGDYLLSYHGPCHFQIHQNMTEQIRFLLK